MGIRSESASESGHLGYSPQSGHLAYKKGSGHLIYPISTDWAIIDIIWGSGGKDLDICGYWTSRPEATVGWAQSGRSFIDGQYQSRWSSGDNTGVAGRERIFVRVMPWDTEPRTYKVHFNYYGASDTYTASTCTVKVRLGDVELVKSGQYCSRNSHSKATKSDPSCTITFGEDGTPLSLM